MPIYSDYGVYSTPSSYVSLYLPYSNHSSIIAANYRSFAKPLSRAFNRGYKPHLATITESQSLSPRRQYSPKVLLHSSPKLKVPKPIKINTADIDVSLNKYRNFDRTNLTPTFSDIEKKQKSPSPSRSPEPQVENDVKTPIRRDRALVRLHTIHKKESPKKDKPLTDTKQQKWRENFDPNDLKTDEKKPRKSPGEMLKEKFIMKDKNEESEVTSGFEKTKSPSFHDICTAISTDKISEELNPGQPNAIQRKQSRQYSTDDIFKAIRRNSAEILKENVAALEDMLKNENLTSNLSNENTEINENRDTNLETDSRNSVKRKKKILKKKSNDKLQLNEPVTSPLQRRATLKKIKRTSTDSSINSEPDPEQEIIRDISQVEVEEIKLKPKPIITATVNIDSKPNLKVIVDDVQVEEVSTPKKQKKFKFNVVVEEIEEKRKSIKRKPITNNKLEKNKLSEDDVGKIQNPQAKDLVISNVQRRNSNSQVGTVLEENTQTKKEEKTEIETETILENTLIKNENGKTGAKNEVECNQNIEETKIDKEPVVTKLPLEKLEVASNEVADKKTVVEQTSMGFSSPKLSDESKTSKGLTPNIKKSATVDNNNKTPTLKNTILSKTKSSPAVIKKSVIVEEQKTITPKLAPKEENQSSDFWALIGNRESVYDKSKKRVQFVERTMGQSLENNNNETNTNSNLIKNENKKEIENATKAQHPIKQNEISLPDSTKVTSEMTVKNDNKETSESKGSSTKNKSKSENENEIKINTPKTIKQISLPEMAVNNNNNNNELSESKVNNANERTNDKSENKTKINAPKAEHPVKEAENEISLPAQSKATNLKTPKTDVIETNENIVVQVNENVIDINQSSEQDSAIIPGKMTSKNSLVKKPTTNDPDLAVFVVPEPEPEPEPEPQPDPNAFVPLQSNRMSQWMHPFRKPEQYDECPVEIYATPKAIRKRHYPRPRHGLPLPQLLQPPNRSQRPQPPTESDSDSDDSDEEETDESAESSDETSSDDDSAAPGQVGASTSSNDSGFDSTSLVKHRNKG